MSLVTRMRYAVTRTQPPQVWSLTETIVNNVVVVTGNIPTGFTEVEKDEYDEALRKQAQAQSTKSSNAEWLERLELGRRRKLLVDEGIPLTVAQILIPDPYGDYSMDETL